jgi:ferredoxin hydrogenase large subunit/hydrogenase large subunit
MPDTITIDPITRIEGHLAFRVTVQGNRVQEAFCSGEMFRGFEVILQGRHPLDAQQITQRICGVCPISHGMASVLAQEQAYSIESPPNGVLLRNLVQAGNAMMSHITHFYHLSVLDFLDVAAITSYTGNDPQLRELKGWVQMQMQSKQLYPAAPFLPRYEGAYAEDQELNIMGLKHYLEALRIRGLCHKMIALFCGKVPHSPALIPGGITEQVTVDSMAAYASLLREIHTFITTAYIPDVLGVAQAFPEYWNIGKGYRNFLAYGAFPEVVSSTPPIFPSGTVQNGQSAPVHESAITEDVLYSFFTPQSGGTPWESQTRPETHKANA